MVFALEGLAPNRALFALAVVLCTVMVISCGPPSAGETPSGNPGNGDQQETLAPTDTSTGKDSQVFTVPPESAASQLSVVTQTENGQQETVHTPDFDSVKEYAEWCGEQERTKEGRIESITTWGEATQTFEQWHSDYEAVEPPAEIKRYHSAQTMALATIYTVAKEEAPDEPFSVFGLVGAGLIMGNSIEEATEALDADVRAILSDSGCLDEGVKGGWQLHHYKDPITDEAWLYFTLKAEASNDDGILVISMDCNAEPRGFSVDVNVFGWAGEPEEMTIRFQDDTAFSETWEWVEDKNGPEHLTESLIAAPVDKMPRYVDRVLKGEKVAIRYPGSPQVSISEATMVFLTDGLVALMEEKGGSYCE